MQRVIGNTMDYVILQKYAMSGPLLSLGAAFNLRPSLLVPAQAILQPCLCQNMYPIFIQMQTLTHGLDLLARH